MDRAYSGAAAVYGFQCPGCAENCCEERFFHYTLVEHAYFMKGFYSLSGVYRSLIFQKAGDVLGRYAAQDQRPGMRVMCPLNFNGLCSLYEYRPMICRLHGIPHRMKKEDGPEQGFPGCHEFETHIAPGKREDAVFDRTEFYSAMAAIEIDLRRTLDFRGSYKKTVAAMIADMKNPGHFLLKHLL